MKCKEYISSLGRRCREWLCRLLCPTTQKYQPKFVEAGGENSCDSLLKNDAYIKLAELCCEMHDELDRMSRQFSDSTMLNFIDMQKSRIREALILSGATAIDEESVFSLLRHKSVSPGIVRDGTPIQETIEPGIAIESRVMIKSKVKV